MRTFATPIAMAAAAAILLSGCGADTSIQDTQKAAEEKVKEATENKGFDVTTAEAADYEAALAAFTDTLGEDPAQLTQFQVTQSSVIVYAVDKDAPDELNAWEFDGKSVCSQSTPVDYGGDQEALKQNIFGSDEISPEALVTALKAAPEASEIKDPELTGLTMKRLLPASTDIIIQVGVRSDREMKDVRFDDQGKLIEVL